MTGIDVSDPLHRTPTIAARLLDGRTSAGAAGASRPTGGRIAFVVATIDLDENTTSTRVWLAGRTATRRRSPPGRTTASPAWSPDGRLLAFTSARGEKEHEATLHVLPVDGPGEVRTVAHDARRHRRRRRGRPTARGSAFISRTRDARYEAKDESWQPPRKIETFFTRLDDEGWIFDRPAHVYVVRRRRHRRRRAT